MTEPYISGCCRKSPILHASDGLSTEMVTAIRNASRIIKSGGVVAMPTETVYGLGGNALDTVAVARIFSIKNRPFFDPLIVHVSCLEQAKACCTAFPDMARKLAEQFWPGPLTLILPKASTIPDLVTSGLPDVAVRMPNHSVALELIRCCGVPLAAPSANPFGALSPTCAEHVRLHLEGYVDAIIDGGPCRVGVESTIVSLKGDRPVLLRAGGIAVEALEHITGPLGNGTEATDKPNAPGQLPSHYAPKTPLFLNEIPVHNSFLRVGLLAYQSAPRTSGFSAIEVLSCRGDLHEAAASLFAALHRLDSLNLDAIVAETCPEIGLGRAINDRLKRAAFGRTRIVT